MIDFATLVSLLAPILLLVVGDRILRWRFAQKRHSSAETPRTSASDVTAPRAAAESSADAEAEPVADRQVA